VTGGTPDLNMHHKFEQKSGLLSTVHRLGVEVDALMAVPMGVATMLYEALGMVSNRPGHNVFPNPSSS
jgi:hypothetical protein